MGVCDTSLEVIEKGGLPECHAEIRRLNELLAQHGRDSYAMRDRLTSMTNLVEDMWALLVRSAALVGLVPSEEEHAELQKLGKDITRRYTLLFSKVS